MNVLKTPELEQSEFEVLDFRHSVSALKQQRFPFPPLLLNSLLFKILLSFAVSPPFCLCRFTRLALLSGSISLVSSVILVSDRSLSCVCQSTCRDGRDGQSDTCQSPWWRAACSASRHPITSSTVQWQGYGSVHGFHRHTRVCALLLMTHRRWSPGLCSM